MTGTKIPCQNPTFYVGQRVKREWSTDESAAMSREPRRRIGTVHEVYAVVGSDHGDYAEVYDVLWDGMTTVSRGYLPHGIDAVPEDEK